jgi:hypothetical protein
VRADLAPRRQVCPHASFSGDAAGGAQAKHGYRKGLFI